MCKRIVHNCMLRSSDKSLDALSNLRLALAVVQYMTVCENVFQKNVCSPNQIIVAVSFRNDFLNTRKFLRALSAFYKVLFIKLFSSWSSHQSFWLWLVFFAVIFLLVFTVIPGIFNSSEGKLLRDLTFPLETSSLPPGSVFEKEYNPHKLKTCNNLLQYSSTGSL